MPGSVARGRAGRRLPEWRIGFVGDRFFELILGNAGACDVGRPSLWRDMVDPVPAQRMVVDLEFSRGSFDRSAGGKQPLDPHALEVITTLAASSPRTFFPGHYIPPPPYRF